MDFPVYKGNNTSFLTSITPSSSINTNATHKVEPPAPSLPRRLFNTALSASLWGAAAGLTIYKIYNQGSGAFSSATSISRRQLKDEDNDEDILPAGPTEDCKKKVPLKGGSDHRCVLLETQDDHLRSVRSGNEEEDVPPPPAYSPTPLPEPGLFPLISTVPSPVAQARESIEEKTRVELDLVIHKAEDRARSRPLFVTEQDEWDHLIEVEEVDDTEEDIGTRIERLNDRINILIREGETVLHTRWQTLSPLSNSNTTFGDEPRTIEDLPFEDDPVEEPKTPLSVLDSPSRRRGSMIPISMKRHRKSLSLSSPLQDQSSISPSDLDQSRTAKEQTDKATLRIDRTGRSRSHIPILSPSPKKKHQKKYSLDPTRSSPSLSVPASPISPLTPLKWPGQVEPGASPSPTESPSRGNRGKRNGEQSEPHFTMHESELGRRRSSLQSRIPVLGSEMKRLVG